MVSQETRMKIAVKANQMLVEEFNRFSNGYIEAQRMMGMRLSDEQKVDFAVSAFKTILETLQKNDSGLLKDYRTVILSPHLISADGRPFWFSLLRQAEQQVNAGH